MLAGSDLRSAQGADEMMGRLRQRLAVDGLHIVLSLSSADFDATVGPAAGPSADTLLPGAGGVVLVGDGGPKFFEAFARAIAPGFPSGSSLADGSEDAQPRAAPISDPLDAYTTEVITAAVNEAIGPWRGANVARPWRLVFPFVQARPALPFQSLGRAAGLPGPGPLGIQIHPLYGPWWAYRALLVVTTPLRTAPALADACVSCSRPCVTACPGVAVRAQGFAYDACSAHRTKVEGGACAASCAARLACPMGTDHRYTERQMAFHMRASLPLVRNTART